MPNGRNDLWKTAQQKFRVDDDPPLFLQNFYCTKTHIIYNLSHKLLMCVVWLH